MILQHFLFTEVANTNDGGYILGGGNLDVGWLIKTNSDGKPQWTKQYSEISMVKSVAQFPDGGFIAVSAHDRQACLVKTDVSGSVLYSSSYGKAGENVSSYASSVVITSDGGYAIAGTFRPLFSVDSRRV